MISRGRRPDQDRIDSLTRARTQLVHQRTPSSREWRERSLKSLPLGVASSFQDAPPYPIFFSVQHTDDDLARYVNAFETFAREVTGR